VSRHSGLFYLKEKAMEDSEGPIRSRATEIPDKPSKRGDVLPNFPEGRAEYRLGNERVTNVKGEKPLSFQEETFIRSYFENGFNHREAAQRARIPYQDVGKMLRKENVRRAMDAIQKEASAELKISQHRIISDLYSMFTAELQSVVEHRRGACRYCWGTAGKYHWRSARERADANTVPPGTRLKPTDDEPDRGKSDGGTGFDEFAAPNPDCIECAGQGVGFVHVKDTAGKKGVQSIEHSPSGKVVVKGYDRTRIGEILLRHLSMVYHDERHKVTNNGPTININGGIPADFAALITQVGGLPNLETQINAEGKAKVAEIQSEANAEEQAEIDAMIAKGEHLE
jgi:phage terminase small subunit